MGFKANTSFVKFLSMGALGVRQTIAQLRAEGFEPIELERYCSSNKIWATKVKRLRMPDVMCVRTGLRLEVRAKSDLAIKMSDAENNETRRWDVGMKDDDLAAFIAVEDCQGGQRAAETANFFSYQTLRDSVASSTLGPPKSVSEGAERDRTWPACIPGKDGVVLEVTDFEIRTVTKNPDGGTRRQPYKLKGKNAYVKAGDKFTGGASIIAGTPKGRATVADYAAKVYNPLEELRNESDISRFAAAKALPFRPDLHDRATDALEAALSVEAEPRVKLEMAGSAARLGSQNGETYLREVIAGSDIEYLRMEGVFILSELRNDFAKGQLRAIANSRDNPSEIRQAAIWGLGKAGIKDYEFTIGFIADEDEDVAMHAIASIGEDIARAELAQLIADLVGGDQRRAPAASETLRLIASETSARLLVEAAADGNAWVIATLGRMPAAIVKPLTDGTELECKLAPALLLSDGASWLANEDRVLDIAFLNKQDIF